MKMDPETIWEWDGATMVPPVNYIIIQYELKISSMFSRIYWLNCMSWYNQYLQKVWKEDMTALLR